MEPLTNGLALPRWDTRRELKIYPDFGYRNYSLRPGDYPTNTVPQPNRWRIGFVPWKRYTSGVTEQPYETPEPLLWAPYHQSVLKGDVPIIGQDIFLDLTASAETVTEFRRMPTASGVSGAVPGEYEFYGESEELSIQNYLAFEVDLFQGETAFRPVDWAVDIQPVFNVNYLQAQETGVVSPSPTGSLANNTPPPQQWVRAKSRRHRHAAQRPGRSGEQLPRNASPRNGPRLISRSSRRSWNFTSWICRTITISCRCASATSRSTRISAAFSSTTSTSARGSSAILTTIFTNTISPGSTCARRTPTRN